MLNIVQDIFQPLFPALQRRRLLPSQRDLGDRLHPREQPEHLPQLQDEQRSTHVLQLGGFVNAVAAEGQHFGRSVVGTCFGSCDERQRRRRRCFGVFPRGLVIGSTNARAVPVDDLFVGSDELVGDEAEKYHML